ncbi:hypothetical protein MicloDRAFT_00000620 [Microvirga lotononidis]|uniref:Uncharacterized protein n=2 Tax=Microvirga lotononidis TaxID=864069 RepID=I4Z4D3_9HYPH|nr:hypothetical protein MicloDRAFT_00000620 [Microvirga lotononidis]
MSALRQVPFVVSTDGAPDTDMLVVDELAVGALGGVVHELELVSHAIGRQATASGQRT